MKKFRCDAKIEYRTLPLEYENNGELRYLQFRICPSELNWWQRIFQNKWRDVFCAYKYFSGYNPLFNVKDAKLIISKYKTWGDICDFLKTQMKNSIKDEKQLKKINNELMWENLK